MALSVIVAYDVSDDADRVRVSALLSHHGVRVQRSVFECVLDAEELKTLLERVRNLVDLSTDTVHAFPLCRPCSGISVRIGQADRPLEERYWIV